MGEVFSVGKTVFWTITSKLLDSFNQSDYNTSFKNETYSRIGDLIHQEMRNCEKITVFDVIYSANENLETTTNEKFYTFENLPKNFCLCGFLSLLLTFSAGLC